MLRELQRKDYGINSLLLTNKRFTNPRNLMIRKCILATSQEQKRRQFSDLPRTDNYCIYKRLEKLNKQLGKYFQIVNWARKINESNELFPGSLRCNENS